MVFKCDKRELANCTTSLKTVKNDVQYDAEFYIFKDVPKLIVNIKKRFEI